MVYANIIIARPMAPYFMVSLAFFKRASEDPEAIYITPAYTNTSNANAPTILKNPVINRFNNPIKPIPLSGSNTGVEATLIGGDTVVALAAFRTQQQAFLLSGLVSHSEGAPEITSSPASQLVLHVPDSTTSGPYLLCATSKHVGAAKAERGKEKNPTQPTRNKPEERRMRFKKEDIINNSKPIQTK
jgi:hypothetical protein